VRLSSISFKVNNCPLAKAASRQGTETEERGQAEETTSPKAKDDDKAETPPQKPRKEGSVPVSGSKSKSQSQTNKSYGSREELEERFGLASNEEEAYRSNALVDINLYRQDVKKAQDGSITLQQGFKGGRRVPSVSPAAPPKTPAALEKEARDALMELVETPVLYETWEERVPPRYAKCHANIMDMHAKGIETAEALLDYTEYYEEADLSEGLDLSKDAEALAHDAERCLEDQ
jgi:hypothetical protein